VISLRAVESSWYTLKILDPFIPEKIGALDDGVAGGVESPAEQIDPRKKRQDQ